MRTFRAFINALGAELSSQAIVVITKDDKKNLREQARNKLEGISFRIQTERVL